MDHGLHVLKQRSFPPNRAPKMQERHQLFFGLGLMSKEFQHPAIQTKIELHFGGFFSSNKSAPANRKTGFANRDPNKQEVGFIFVWSGSELWSLFKYSRVKLKNQKPIAEDVQSGGGTFKSNRLLPFLIILILQYINLQYCMQGKFACNVLLTTKKTLTKVNREKPVELFSKFAGFCTCHLFR